MKRSSPTRLPTVTVVLQHIIFLSLVLIPHTSCKVDPDYVNQVMELTKQGVTEAQVQKWWFRAQAMHRDFPRVFPFCYDTKLKVFGGAVAGVKKVMEDLNPVRDYDPSVYGWPGRRKTHFDSMSFNRIQIQRAQPKTDVFDGEEGKNPYDLQQWVDFVVKFRTSVNRFFVQAIGGPLGVPTGEFTKDFRCTHGDTDESNYDSNASLEPCHFSPRTAITWPNVFSWVSSSPQTKIKFRYRWTESHCHETAFFQFIMIAFSSAGNTPHTILSPVFHYVNMDTPSGVISPYHSYYDKITCGPSSKQTAYNTNLVMIGNGLRIIPNKQYDDCVMKGKDRSTNPLERDTCPPGPFRCSQYWNNVQGWKQQMDNWWDKIVVKPLEDCCEVKFPLNVNFGATTPEPSEPPAPDPTGTPVGGQTTTTESPLQIRQKEQEKFLTVKTRKFQLKHQITHGDICILVWLIFVPIADNVVRYFKDFSEIKSLGLGFWIILHITLHSIGLMMVWWSFGLVVGASEDTLGDFAASHIITGILTTVLQHVQFITGLKRKSNERERFNYVLTHSFSGYFSHAGGYLSVLLSSAGTTRKLTSMGLFLLWLLSSLAFYIAEKRQDKALGVVLHRAQCPVLQRIVIDGGPPPLAKIKIAILAVLIIGQGSIFTAMLLNHSAEREAILKSVNITLDSI